MWFLIELDLLSLTIFIILFLKKVSLLPRYEPVLPNKSERMLYFFFRWGSTKTEEWIITATNKHSWIWYQKPALIIEWHSSLAFTVFLTPLKREGFRIALENDKNYVINVFESRDVFSDGLRAVCLTVIHILNLNIGFISSFWKYNITYLHKATMAQVIHLT